MQLEFHPSFLYFWRKNENFPGGKCLTLVVEIRYYGMEEYGMGYSSYFGLEGNFDRNNLVIL